MFDRSRWLTCLHRQTVQQPNLVPPWAYVGGIRRSLHRTLARSLTHTRSRTRPTSPTFLELRLAERVSTEGTDETQKNSKEKDARGFAVPLTSIRRRSPLLLPLCIPSASRCFPLSTAGHPDRRGRNHRPRGGGGHAPACGEPWQRGPLHG